MKEIELTKGVTTVVDDEDYEYLTQNFGEFCAVNNHGQYYAKTTKVIDGSLRHLFVHRIILERMLGRPIEGETDHIDRNPLNNLRNNLREVTHQENMQNRARKRNPICPKCGKNEKYGWYAYCLPCFNEYQKERRKNNPEIRKRETQYKRDYRQRLKDGLVLKRGE